MHKKTIQQQFDLTGRVAIVTGGVGLLGSEFCWTLAQAGAAVIVADLNGEAAADLADSLTQSGYQSRGVKIDVTNVDSIDAAVSATLSTFGRLDILVNSAALDPKVRGQESVDQESGEQGTGKQGAGNQEKGISSPDSLSLPFEDYPLKLWQRALDVNLTGAMLCCQAVAKPMLKQESGVIINIASIYGLTAPDQRLYQRDGQPHQYKPAYYTVTKAGILGLTKYLAAYYAGSAARIRVNALTPGGVYNNQSDDFVQVYSARAVLGRMAEKDEMNGALLFLASDASRYMTGANLIVDGGWTTW
ncbi:MAG: SDR family oxidoreductase [Chloroflexota bacterium]|nr:SDR family oxidoreductase [Chloroflexota bacterium]